MTQVENERKKMKEMFRERLRILIGEKGISDATLARAIGVSPATVSKYLNDENKEPLFHIVMKIANYFEVSPDWLGGLSDDRNPECNLDVAEIYYQLSDASKRELHNFAYFLLNKEKTSPADIDKKVKE